MTGMTNTDDEGTTMPTSRAMRADHVEAVARMTNTDDTMRHTIYDDVIERLAEDDEPYAFLFGMASQLLRSIVRTPDDRITRKMSTEFVRALDDHDAKVRAEREAATAAYEQAAYEDEATR